jgi:hypothetical protein
MTLVFGGGMIYRAGLLDGRDSDVAWTAFVVASLIGGLVIGAVWTAFPKISPIK